MLPILLSAGVLLGLAAALEVWTPRRADGRPDPDLWAKLIGLAALLVVVVWLWEVRPGLRWPLLALPLAAWALRNLRSRGRLARLPRVLFLLGSPFLFPAMTLAILYHLSEAVSAPGVEARAVSPDGRWEARLVEHPGIAYCVDEIVLAPRGLTTLDPTAYPSVPLGETNIEGELDHFSWPDPRTLVLHLRPWAELPPVLDPNPHVSVRVVNLTPPPPPGGEIL